MVCCADAELKAELYELFTVSPFHADVAKPRANLKECVRNISFSAWNPPPGNRRLRGDLLYLEVSTLEEHALHITASVDGFFVNRSSAAKFDPAPADAPYKSHTLVELLKKVCLVCLIVDANCCGLLWLCRRLLCSRRASLACCRAR